MPERKVTQPPITKETVIIVGATVTSMIVIAAIIVWS